MSALKFHSKNFFLPVIIVVILIASVLTFYTSRAKAPGLPATNIISRAALEEKYGVRVNLVALTAAGGMVDLRLKIIDSKKASLLLADKNNFPALYVDNTGMTLNVSQDEKSQGIKLEDNGDVFLLFSNAGNTLKPGATVIILFGDLAIEPVVVK